MLVFRWKPGSIYRYKKTEICKTCAKLKNVCQTCILDLQYGLPVQVRDEALAKEDQTAILQKDTLPVSHTNRNYMYEQLEHQVGLGGTNSSLQLPYDSIEPANGGNAMLQRMHRKGPYYKRNLPHICSFYVRGICNRGDACPYRHVHPEEEKQDDSLKDQNIKDRFYGVNDPVAKKLMRKYNEWTHGTDDADGDGANNRKRRRELPSPPSDVTIRTLFIGGIDWSVSEDLIRNKLKEYGEITTVALLPDRKCGFVTFGTRENAENAMSSLFDVFYLNKRKCELNWARSKGDKGNTTSSSDAKNSNTNTEAEKTKSNESGKGTSSTSHSNTIPTAPITRDEQEFLKRQGIVPPNLPPMPDPIACANTAYTGNTSTMYRSMTAHYKEAKIQ